MPQIKKVTTSTKNMSLKEVETLLKEYAAERKLGQPKYKVGDLITVSEGTLSNQNKEVPFAVVVSPISPMGDDGMLVGYVTNDGDISNMHITGSSVTELYSDKS